MASCQIEVGAEQTDQYFELLKGKKLGIVANQTSFISKTHLVDSLLNAGFTIEKVFAPEHGFRGQAEAGELVSGNIDSKSGLEIVSLYGSHKKPTKKDLENIDLMIFDIQDVGARFYTYISTLKYVMEACAEYKIPLLLLDRPNPNGHYVDGPMLEDAYKSFIGLLPLPVVHGMTLGELSQMINQEGWLNNHLICDLQIIKCEHYTHQSFYSLPVPPSPNLPTDNSIDCYPSLCFFEGTVMSLGRGTEFPFEVLGHPNFPEKDFSFKPRSIEGKSLHPKFEGEFCYGIDFRKSVNLDNRATKIDLQLLIDTYSKMGKPSDFFIDFFHLLAGNKVLAEQIKAGFSEQEIRASWEPELGIFKSKRKNYLIYPE